ncbi:UTP--glucose-1-phosphate uridylyltransferase [Calothrix sp. PCC 6303]|uniref:UTP--glucose-1-phosphate uridylyltransferase n=1 Tax=Calothrix sp. PCC 6303 TaxID=1170562 RepID=UPI0002A044BF|nr:UTP--glucose-1-phosphate uridylyltransferase [Calothrix sp. PCC 6303]AFZ00111.1 UTP--glucose-1-phosphate uridylyltransferase [Calothrix sp. PCC 6303]
MPANRIRKAVIPAAGFGTRLFPSTKVVKKELFPIIDRDGRAKPVILLIIEEAIKAGIEEVAIIVQPDDKKIFKTLFKRPPSAELFEKLSPENQVFSKYLVDLGDRITILTQDRQEGYGHAVYCAKKWVGDEAFLLMLGDHIYTSYGEKSCAAQILNIFNQVNQSVIGLTKVTSESLHQVGCVTGIWQQQKDVLSVTQIAEKPSIDYAHQNLRMDGLCEDEFLSIFGLYALTPTIFDCLEQDIQNNKRMKGEFQLTTCLDSLRQIESMTGYFVNGKCFDIGLPSAYLQTLIDFKNR